MSGQANIKYAYLVLTPLHPFPRDVDFAFDEHTHLRSGNLKNHVNRSGWDHWRKWLGSITWEALSHSNKLILSTWKMSATPEVIDQENFELEVKLKTIFRALPLVATYSPPSDDAFVFSGRGSIIDGKLSVDEMRTFSRAIPWTRAYYDEKHWQLHHDWSRSILTSDDRLQEWKLCVDHFNNHAVGANLKRQISESYRSFDEALHGSQLEFKIPNLVRSIECLIDCWGEKAFAKRVLFLTGPLPADLPFSIAEATLDKLENLYQLRNDCSHGKPFAYSLEKKLGRFPDGETIASYEFLAEWVARKILKDSFVNQSLLSASSDRDSLVFAWKNKLIAGSEGRPLAD